MGMVLGGSAKAATTLLLVARGQGSTALRPPLPARPLACPWGGLATALLPAGEEPRPFPTEGKAELGSLRRGCSWSTAPSPPTGLWTWWELQPSSAGLGAGAGEKEARGEVSPS